MKVSETMHAYKEYMHAQQGMTSPCRKAALSFYCIPFTNR